MIKSKKQGKFMNCPNCNKEVELTTKRYFLWIFLSIIFVLFSSLFIMNFITNKEVLDSTYMVYLVILFFVYCFIDRKIEDNLPTKAI